MAKKTLGISVQKNQYDAVIKHLDEYNYNRELKDKITCSHFLFELVKLAFKIYKMNNNDFDSSHKFLDKLKNETDNKQIKIEKQAELAADNIVETADLKSFVKAKIGIKS